MQKMRICHILFLLAFCYKLSAQIHTKEIGVQVDNDAFLAAGSDRYYTDGIFIFYNTALQIKKINTHLANKILGFEAGQKIFMPHEFITDPYWIDRPYAGYLYTGASLNMLYINESNLKIKLQSGVIGPSALGEQVQRFVHTTFNFPKATGWKYQVQDLMVINVSAEYNKLLGRNANIDGSFNTYINMGTAFNGMGAGATVRIGRTNKLFNSISTQSTSIRNSVLPTNTKEFFFYYKPAVNLVLYDATIQGSLFKHYPGNDEIIMQLKHFIISNQLGLAHSSNRLVVNIAAVFTTRDVKKMDRAHQWGSVTILYRYR